MSAADGAPEGYAGIGDYMVRKRAKLSVQHAAADGASAIFAGMRFHVNGYTDPPAERLRELVVEHGGAYEQYYHSKRAITMLATHLPHAKASRVTAGQVVLRPEWVLDCVARGARLPLDGYRLYGGEAGGAGTLPALFAPHSPPAEPAGRTTASDPNFLQNYYRSSRLHHLSAWREDLRQFAKTLPLGACAAAGERFVLHVDMDCFFASVSTRDRPDLAGQPVGISHSAGAGARDDSSSDLASVNYAARAAGLSNGMYVRRALELCPGLAILPYDFDLYKEAAYALYRVLARHAAALQAVSCDEALIAAYAADGPAADALADALRAEIREACGCSASVGIGPNMLVARLATRRAKPDGRFRVADPDLPAFMAGQRLADLPGVGPSIRSRLAEHGLELCGDLDGVPVGRLQELLGPKLGRTVTEHAQGIDGRQLDADRARRSVGTEVSWGVRLDTRDQRDHFVRQMALEVFDRLQALGGGVAAGKLQVRLLTRQPDAGAPSKRLGRGPCDTVSRTAVLPRTAMSAALIAQEALRTIDACGAPVGDIRGIGIFLVDLREPARSYDWAAALGKPPLAEAAEAAGARDAYLRARGFQPAVFAELDADLQEQLLHEWGYYNTAAAPATPPKGHRVLAGPGVDFDPEAVDSATFDPATFDSEAFGSEAFDAPLCSTDAWARAERLLEAHDYERVGRLVAAARGAPGADALVERVQAWFGQHEGGRLFLAP